jgi:divalent metal cation (Fe/Co/Zn/Cd) transporter
MSVARPSYGMSISVRQTPRVTIRSTLAQRIALAALAIFLILNAVTPFLTPDPPWLANLPLVVAIMAFLLAFGLSHIRAERARAVEAAKDRKQWPDGAKSA